MSLTQRSMVLHAVTGLSAGPATAEGAESFEVCIPNISTRERRKRLHAGIIQFGIGLGVLAALVARDVNRWWRLPLGLVFFGAGASFFQWRDKT